MLSAHFSLLFPKQSGVCASLSLSGRANKEVGVLSTSQFYRLANQTVAFIPQVSVQALFILYLLFLSSHDVFSLWLDSKKKGI